MPVTGNFNVGNARNPLLNANEIFSAIFNMIISQKVFSDNIKGTYGDLASRFKIDGTLYGDTKLFYATDALKSTPWGADNEATNLLALNRPDDPKCQYVQIDQFRKIWVTIDNYLTKRAWSTEGAFSQFNSVTIGWMADTKRVYESRLINTFIGTNVSAATRGVINIDITNGVGSATGEEANRLEASTIANDMANLIVDLKDTTRDFNDYGFLRSYAPNDLTFVWNAKWVNKIKKIDLPTMFHKDGLIEKMDENILPARYFGHLVSATDKGSGKVIDANGVYDNTKGTIRSLVEKDYTVSNTTYHVFPGDALVNGATVKASGNFEEAEVYVEDDTVICKVMQNDAVPFMSAFSVNTSFYNPRSLTENHYLIWGYSQPCYLYNRPFLTIKKV